MQTMEALGGASNMANTGIARHLNEQEISFTRQSVRCDQNVLRVETRNFQIDQLITSIGALHAIREDARDLFKARLQRLDNLLFVTTLLLTVGFGCVLEGTFPPPEAAQEDEFELCVYATLCGLALVFPFFGLLCIVQCKGFLEHAFQVCVNETKNILTDQILCNPVLDDLQVPFGFAPLTSTSTVDASASTGAGKGEDSVTRSVSSSSFATAEESCQSRDDQRGKWRFRDWVQKLKKRLDFWSPPSVKKPLIREGMPFIKIVRRINNLNRECWDERCEWLQTLAQWFLRASMVTTGLLCAVLIALVFKYRFKRDSGIVWIAYTLTLGIGILLGCLCYHALLRCSVRKEEQQQPSAEDTEQGNIRRFYSAKPFLSEPLEDYSPLDDVSVEHLNSPHAVAQIRRAPTEQLLIPPSDERRRYSEVPSFVARPHEGDSAPQDFDCSPAQAFSDENGLGGLLLEPLLPWKRPNG